MPPQWRVYVCVYAFSLFFSRFPDSHTLRLVLILGLLSAIGPFAIDMYLPALPQIGSSLGAQVGAVQASLTAFFLSLGVGQLLYGPVRTWWGASRRCTSA